VCLGACGRLFQIGGGRWYFAAAGTFHEAAERAPVYLVEIFLHEPIETAPVNLVEVLLHEPVEPAPVDFVEIPLLAAERHAAADTKPRDRPLNVDRPGGTRR